MPIAWPAARLYRRMFRRSRDERSWRCWRRSAAGCTTGTRCWRCCAACWSPWRTGRWGRTSPRTTSGRGPLQYFESVTACWRGRGAGSWAPCSPSSAPERLKHGGQRIRTSTGLPPAVFKTAALPVRSSPPDRRKLESLGDHGQSAAAIRRSDRPSHRVRQCGRGGRWCGARQLARHAAPPPCVRGVLPGPRLPIRRAALRRGGTPRGDLPAVHGGTRPPLDLHDRGNERWHTVHCLRVSLDDGLRQELTIALHRRATVDRRALSAAVLPRARGMVG